jgi:hypothetical protein
VINATLIGWLLPGAGHWVLGQRGKAVMFASIIFVTFFVGVALAGGHAVSFEREQLYFWGEFGAAVPALLGLGLDGVIAIEEIPSTYHLGLLYATVAGLLNLVVAVDAMGVALSRDRGRGAPS